jgi:signal transduction histidine kinase
MPTELHALPAESIHRLLGTKSLAEVPASICSLTKGDACVIWKPSRTLAEQSPPNCDTTVGRLYPYSSNFGSKEAIQHAGIALEIEQDTTGRFYRSGDHRSFDNDFRTKDCYSPSDNFVKAHNLQKVCLARFKMPDASKGDFVVSVYRQSNSADFSEEDSVYLEELSKFLPELYQRLVASQLQSAIVNVNGILRPRCSDAQQAEKPLQDLCQKLAELFHFREISIFMQSRISVGEDYSLVASTFPLELIPKNKYRASTEDGITGYCLKTKKLIWFHDLHNFQHPQRRIQIEKLFPGIQWSDGAAFGKLAKEMFGLAETDLNPPLPFVGVPVLGGDGNVLGLLRASLGANPFHFLQDQVDAFEIIAKEIGRWWDSMLYGVEQQRRGEVWKALDQTIRTQHDAFNNAKDIEKLIAATVQSIVEQPKFSLATFRRGNTECNLRVEAFALQEPITKLGRVIPPLGSLLPLAASKLPKPDTAQGFFVGKISRTADEIASAGSTEEVKTFHAMSRVLSCPVYFMGRLYGVLDVGFASELDFKIGQERIEQFVRLAARQLALFVRISESVAEAQAAIAKELRTNSVVTHQLRTPIETAYKTLRKLVLLKPAQWTETACKRLEETAGMVGKARSVTHTIDAFGKIVAAEQVEAHCKFVSANDAKKAVIEAALNVRAVSAEQMELEFKIEPEGWGMIELLWDDELAQQCLDAVISNAFKYSGVGELVAIFGEKQANHFIIRVVNTGPYIIRFEDLENCKKMDWRGPLARKQEGRGLGLWIVDHWMRAQGGKLEVYPTSKSTNETRIELWFARQLNERK